METTTLLTQTSELSETTKRKVGRPTKNESSRKTITSEYTKNMKKTTNSPKLMTNRIPEPMISEEIKDNTSKKKIVPIVDQVRMGMMKQNRLPMILGFIMGGFIPFSVFIIGHYETPTNPFMWILVTAGLIYSATTVFQWAEIIFKNPWKSLGFVVLIEGVMTFSHTWWLSVMGLGLLIVINGIATGCTLSLDRKDSKN